MEAEPVGDRGVVHEITHGWTQLRIVPGIVGIA